MRCAVTVARSTRSTHTGLTYYPRRGYARRAPTPLSTIASDEDERTRHAERMDALGDGYDAEVAVDIERLKLGRRKGWAKQTKIEGRREYTCDVRIAGTAVDYAELPVLDQPEIALCGRSNCGKSSLLNALCGQAPKKGVASVHHRPGWTQYFTLYEVCEVGHDEPFMSLLDLPGYGAASQARTVRSKWARAMRGYLQQRNALTCVFVLIDATMGVAPEDLAFMAQLDARARPFHVVMTKADLLAPRQLAQSAALVAADLEAAAFGQIASTRDVPLVSSTHAQGISELWQRLAMGVHHLAEQKAVGEAVGEAEDEAELEELDGDEWEDVEEEDGDVMGRTPSQASASEAGGRRKSSRRKRRRSENTQ